MTAGIIGDDVRQEIVEFCTRSKGKGMDGAWQDALRRWPSIKDLHPDDVRDLQRQCRRGVTKRRMHAALRADKRAMCPESEKPACSPGRAAACKPKEWWVWRGSGVQEEKEFRWTCCAGDKCDNVYGGPRQRESRHRCRKEDGSSAGVVTINWGHAKRDATWACNAWKLECGGKCKATRV